MIVDFAVLLEIGYPTPLRLSSFDMDVTVSGKTYDGGRVEEWTAITNSTGSPGRRATVTIKAVDSAIRTALLTDSGPVDVEILFATRARSAAWTLIPKKVVGSLSETRYSAGRAEITIETLKGTVYAGRVLVMSDAMQRERFPSPVPDQAFEYIQRFREEGILERPPPT